MPDSVSINLKLAKNGVVLSYYKHNSDGPGEDVTYVYDSMEEALKELSSIISVAKEDEIDNPKDTSSAKPEAD